MTSTKVDLWHKQYTSTLPTSNDSIISLTLNTIEIALRLSLGENASSSLIDDILLSPFGSSLYTFKSKSTHSNIEPSHILSKINRYKSSFESLDLIQNDTTKLHQVLTTLNIHVSQTKQAVSCILRDKIQLNMILLYKNYKSNTYILYEPRSRLQHKLNGPHFLLFTNDKLLSLFLKNIFSAANASNEYMANFIQYKSNKLVCKDIDFYLLCKDLKIIGVELKLKNENIEKAESHEATVSKAENWLYNKLKQTQFKDMDADENLVLDRAEFHAFFQFYGMDNTFMAIYDAIFDTIDANNDGTVSLIEWFTWQNKFNKKDLHKIFVAKFTTDQLLNESNTVIEVKTNIKNKKKATSISPQNKHISETVQHIYDEYLKQYGYEPKLPTHLMHFSKKIGSKISFIQCRNVIMINKEKIKIDEENTDEDQVYKINKRPMYDDSGFLERPQIDKMENDEKEENKPFKINKRPMYDDSGFLERPIFAIKSMKWFESEQLATECTDEKENDFRLCFCVNRIANIMKAAKQSVQCVFDKFFCVESKDDNDNRYSITTLVNDYHHLIEQHDAELEDITSFLASEYDLKCFGTNCEYLSRNYRNRTEFSKNNESKLYKTSDKKLILISKQLDKIHAYLLHSFDLNYRLSKTEKLQIFPPQIENKQEEKDHKKEDIEQDDDTQTIEIIQKMQKVIEKKEFKMRKLMGDERMQSTKFVTNIEESNQSMVEEKKMVESAKTVSQVSATEYSFGFPFKYYQRFRHGKWFIKKKYNNIKDELLNNPLQTISLNDYNNQLDSANIFMQCNQLKCLECHHVDLPIEPQQSDTGLADKSAITVPHILSLLLYCNFSNLCTTFSSTFRRIRKDETDEQVKNRNSLFRNWSQLLFEAIHLYGTPLEKKSFGQCVFHGVNRIMVFENMNQNMNGPFSTTSQMQVALQFATVGGLMLTLNRSSGIMHNKYFDCACISDYSGESEKLFMGGRLQIIDILHIPTQNVFGWYCKAFTVLTSMLSADPVNMKIVKRKHAKLYLTMMNENNLNKFPEYIQSVWTYTTQQIKCIEIDLQLMIVDKVDTTNDNSLISNLTSIFGRTGEVEEPDKYGYKSLNSFLMIKNEWINLQRLCDLLPNLEYIAISRYKRLGQYQHIQDSILLNDSLIDNLLQYQPKTQMTISLNKPDESEMSISTFIDQCRAVQKNKIKNQFVAMTGTIDVQHVGNGKPLVWISFNDTRLHQACANGEHELVSQLLSSDDEKVNTKSKYTKATALFVACDQGHVECVKQLLCNESVDINQLDRFKKNVLMICVRHSRNDIALILLEHSDRMEKKGIKHGVLDINQCDDSGESVLHKAVTHSNQQIIEVLIKHKLNPNLLNSKGDTALLIACKKQQTNIIETLLKCGADADIPNVGGQTPLMVCIEEKNTAGVELLVKYSADLNIINPHCKKNTRSATSLYYAVKEGNKGFVSLLLAAGADPTLIDSNGQTLLHIAADETQLEILKLLYEAAVNEILTSQELLQFINHKDENGETILYRAARYSNAEALVEFLINTAKCDVNIVNNEGKSALNEAVYMSSLYFTGKSIKLLINSGANVGIVDKEGQTMLFAACGCRDKDLLELLYNEYLGDKNDFVNQRDNKGVTVLCYACKENDETGCVEFLMSVGAEIMIFDNDGRSVFHYAAQNYHGDKLMKLIYDKLRSSWQCWPERIIEFINHRDNNHETALFIACEYKESAKYLISVGGEIDPKCNINRNVAGSLKYNETALSKAADAGCLELVNMLLNCDAKIDVFDYRNQTPLHKAAGEAHLEILQILYSTYLQKTDIVAVTKLVNHKDENNETALFSAAAHNNDKGGPECVEFLLSVGADVSIFNKDGWSVLFQACEYLQPKSVKPIYYQYLKNTNIEAATKFVNATNKRKQTALHAVTESCSDSREYVIGFLLNVGATVTAKDEEGNSVLHKAAGRDNVNVVKSIYEHYLQNVDDDEEKTKKFLESMNENGETPLLVAARRSRSDVLKYLHSVGAEFNVRDGVKGRTPLHWTFTDNHSSVDATKLIYELYIQNLSKEEAEKYVNAQDFSKATALHIGCGETKDNINKIKYLLEHTDCDVNVKDRHNDTPLMNAARKGYTDIVELLLNVGADLVDSNGNCEALGLARKTRKECAKVIEDHLLWELPVAQANKIFEKYPEEYDEDNDGGSCLIM